MISPASGIHRPSYNGAPAIQTITKRKGLKPFLVRDSPCAVTCAHALHAPLAGAFIKPFKPSPPRPLRSRLRRREHALHAAHATLHSGITAITKRKQKSE